MGRGIRQVMLSAKPWQRYVLSGAIIAVGIVLTALGHVHGVILVVLGTLFLVETDRHRISTRRRRARSADTEKTD